MTSEIDGYSKTSSLLHSMACPDWVRPATEALAGRSVLPIARSTQHSKGGNAMRGRAFS
jgi:hypothetical protein